MTISPWGRCLALTVVLFSVWGSIAAEPVGGVLPPQKEAEALIISWSEAQNKGDFNSYASLYHDSFEGIKRSGTREYRYRYREWLADRKKMFSSRFVVTVDALELKRSDDAWTAAFIQTWESGTYKDRGAKIMILQPSGGRLVITREEMLNSTVMTPTSNIKDLTHNGRLFFVLDGKYIVFAEGYDAALGQGAPIASGAAGPVNEGGVIKAVASAKVQQHYRDLAREEYVVYDRKNNPRRVRLERLWLMTKYVPHWGELEQYQAEGKLTADILQAMWETGSSYEGNVFLVGEIRGVIPYAVWGCLSKLPRPVAYEEAPYDDSLERKVKSAGIKEVEDPSFLKIHEPTIHTKGYRHPVSGKIYYLFTLRAGGRPCSSEKSIEIIRVYIQHGSGVRKLPSFSVPAWSEPGVFDVDGDGSPEFIFHRGYGVLLEVESLTLEGYLSVPFLDCGC